MVNKKCSVCNEKFSCSFNGADYCNKHYLRMYNNGTLEKIARRKNRFEIKDDFVILYTNSNKEFLIDKEDFEKVKKHSWCLLQNKYLVANVNGKSIRLHRFIMGINDKKIFIDHINGCTFDNRKENLRKCSLKENSRNCKISKNNTTGYTGIRKTKSGKYKARIYYNRKEISLGTYQTFEEAKEARIKGEEKYFKEFSPYKGALRDI